MASIIHADIVGIRMAEEGSGGFTVNSTNYSVLLFYDNGTVELIEGDARHIRPFLSYMKPRGDFSHLQTILKQFEETLKDDISTIARQAVEEMLLDSSNPIPPGIPGKSKTDAKAILESAGFKVEYIPCAPEETTGTVIKCSRKSGDHMTVVLKIKYDVPNVDKLNAEEAIRTLKNAGFVPTIKKCENTAVEQNTVFKVERVGDGIEIILWVSDNFKNQEHNFVDSIRPNMKFKDIYDLWQQSGLSKKYPNVEEYIAKQKYIERMYGKLMNVDEEIKTIQSMLIP